MLGVHAQRVTRDNDATLLYRPPRTLCGCASRRHRLLSPPLRAPLPPLLDTSPTAGRLSSFVRDVSRNWSPHVTDSVPCSLAGGGAKTRYVPRFIQRFFDTKFPSTIAASSAIALRLRLTSKCADFTCLITRNPQECICVKDIK